MRKNGAIVFWIMGLCAFVALMCNGFVWLLSLIDASWSFLGTVSNVAGIVLTVSAVIAGWLWISSCRMNKTIKLVLQILFIVFAVLAVCGYLSIGL